MSKPMMACGHAATGRTEDGKPVCTTCVGIKSITVVEQPDLTGRKAVCSYGQHAKVSSSTDLAFFEYRPDEENDRYYCGCFGWN